MLSPSFCEGIELSASGAVEISCPEDDGEHMAIFCYVIHHQASKASISKSDAASKLKDLIKLAKLSDKYDLGEAMKTQAYWWLSYALEVFNKVDRTKGNEYLGQHEVEDRYNSSLEWVIAAAHYFGLGGWFSKAAIDNIIKGLSPMNGKDSVFAQWATRSCKFCVSDRSLDGTG